MAGKMGVNVCGRDLRVPRDRENETHLALLRPKKRGIVTVEVRPSVDGGLFPAWL